MLVHPPGEGWLAVRAVWVSGPVPTEAGPHGLANGGAGEQLAGRLIRPRHRPLEKPVGARVATRRLSSVMGATPPPGSRRGREASAAAQTAAAIRDRRARGRSPQEGVSRRYSKVAAGMSDIAI